MNSLFTEKKIRFKITVPCYRQRESLLLSKEAEQIADEEQKARLPEDPWKGSIAKYVADKESVVMDEILLHALGMKDQKTGTDAIKLGLGQFFVSWVGKREEDGDLAKKPPTTHQ